MSLATRFVYVTQKKESQSVKTESYFTLCKLSEGKLTAYQQRELHASGCCSLGTTGRRREIAVRMEVGTVGIG